MSARTSAAPPSPVLGEAPLGHGRPYRLFPLFHRTGSRRPGFGGSFLKADVLGSVGVLTVHA